MTKYNNNGYSELLDTKITEVISIFSEKTTKGIKKIIKKLMNNVIQRRVYDEPWNYEQEKNTRPFHMALVPKSIWKGAKFERSFVTSLGMIGWEQIARLLAEEHHGYAENGYKVKGEMTKAQMHKIQNILNQLEGNREPNSAQELKQVLELAENDNLIQAKVTSDLYIHNTTTDTHYYLEIKAPKPNSDQTKVSKEKILKIKAMHPEDNHKAYFALPYNPYGDRANYNWSHPKRWFKMKTSPLVKIGKEFWDLAGGQGAYEDLIDLFEDVGEQYRNIIEDDYLEV